MITFFVDHMAHGEGQGKKNGTTRKIVMFGLKITKDRRYD
jgi:hypothetical protein